jgi:hypothetical protein
MVVGVPETGAEVARWSIGGGHHDMTGQAGDVWCQAIEFLEEKL